MIFLWVNNCSLTSPSLFQLRQLCILRVGLVCKLPARRAVLTLIIIGSHLIAGRSKDFDSHPQVEAGSILMGKGGICILGNLSNLKKDDLNAVISGRDFYLKNPVENVQKSHAISWSQCWKEAKYLILRHPKNLRSPLTLSNSTWTLHFGQHLIVKTPKLENQPRPCQSELNYPDNAQCVGILLFIGFLAPSSILTRHLELPRQKQEITRFLHTF